MGDRAGRPGSRELSSTLARRGGDVSTVVVGTTSGLFRVGDGEPHALAGRSVDALSEDATWAIVDAAELWRRSDSWAPVAAADRWRLTCVLPFREGALVGTAEAHLARFDGEALRAVEPFEQVPGREDWFTPWGGPPDVRSLAYSGGAVFVNVHVGGIVKGDGESGWRPTVDISTDVHEVRALGDTLVAACAVGYAESADGGSSWSFDERELHSTYARAVAGTSDAVYMSVARGPRGGDAGIYTKQRTGGAAFRRCDLPSFSDNIDTGCLDATDELVAFGTKDGEVYASRDQGATWEGIARGLPQIRCVVVSADRP